MKISELKISSWAKMGQNATFFGVAIPEVKKQHENLMAITADVGRTFSMRRFARMYPEDFVNVGIAEQDLINIAAGMALEGGKVYAATYASFITIRCLEQIRQNLSYLQTDVKLVGCSAGYTMESLSASHWATEDIAAVRALPGMTVLSAADSLEAYKIAEATANMNSPAYIRLSGEGNSPIVYKSDFCYEIGKGILITEGKNVAIIATGRMVHEALTAADSLKKKGICCTVVDMHTIKPLDVKLLDQIFAQHDLIMTVEEHNVIGGLGSAIAEYRADKADKVKQIIMGTADCFLIPGDTKFLWKQAGITAEQIEQRILSEI